MAKNTKNTDPTREGDVAETTQGETSVVVSSESNPESPVATPEQALIPDPVIQLDQQGLEPKPEVEPEIIIESNSIETEQQAFDHVKENYPSLKGGLVLVTQDKNVFDSNNISSGYNHAAKNNLKSFRVQCLD